MRWRGWLLALGLFAVLLAAMWLWGRDHGAQVAAIRTQERADSVLAVVAATFQGRDDSLTRIIAARDSTVAQSRRSVQRATIIVGAAKAKVQQTTYGTAEHSVALTNQAAALEALVSVVKQENRTLRQSVADRDALLAARAEEIDELKRALKVPVVATPPRDRWWVPDVVLGAGVSSSGVEPIQVTVGWSLVPLVRRVLRGARR